MVRGEVLRESHDRRMLGALAVTVGVVAALVVLPYLTYVLAAVVLAYVLYPLQRRLQPRLGRTTAALVGLLVATVAILFPIGVLVAVAVGQAVEVADTLAAEELDVNVFEDRLEGYGLEVDLVDLYTTFEEPIEAGLRGLAADALGIVGGLPGFLIGMTVLVFVLYSLLRDGRRLVVWGKSVLPLRAELQDDLVVHLDRLMWASVVANAVVAAIQAGLTVIGLAIVGVPGLAFFGILTFIFALLPLVGAFAVWAPVAIYLFAIGQPFAGTFLVVYGSIVSASDNYLRPVTVGRSANMSAATVIVGIFGGVAIFGIMGLFIGPVVLGAFQAVLELYAREREGEVPASRSRPEPGLVGVKLRAGEARRPAGGETSDE
ncbi:AI-2E family transporter [Natrialbaceae archaeon A-gly3]